MNETTDPRVWIEIAEEDLRTAESALHRKNPMLRTACFHAQQCAEKYLKAALVAHRQSFQKTHDLYALSELCAKAGILLEMDKDKLDLLSSHAALVRYPGLPLEIQDAKDALATARIARKFVRTLLGVK